MNTKIKLHNSQLHAHNYQRIRLYLTDIFNRCLYIIDQEFVIDF